MQLKKAVALICGVGVGITILFFIYTDQVVFIDDNFVEPQKTLYHNYDGNHFQMISDFFDLRASDEIEIRFVPLDGEKNIYRLELGKDITKKLSVYNEPSSTSTEESEQLSSEESTDYLSEEEDSTPEEEVVISSIPNDTQKTNHKRDIDAFFEARKLFNVSELGKYLFLNEEHPQNRSREYKILVWKDGDMMENRHLYYFHDERHEPFDECSVKNCYLDYEDSSAVDADAILVLLHRMQGVESLPNVTRPEGQRWVFLTDESPHNTFTLGRGPWQNLDGLFNWSMSYKTESDIPVPYGRTVALPTPIVHNDDMDAQEKLINLVPNANKKRRDVLAAILMSNCGSNNGRLKYVKELQQYIDVDFYGHCSDTLLKNKCPGSYGDDCALLEDYMFYLSFENSGCDEYISEKTFCHGYRKGSIPVVMGTRGDLLKLLLPPESYLNVYDFESPKELAERMLHINSTNENYLELHDWRRHFEVVNEHGYFNAPSYHYCRLCEALNYNDESPKVYGLKELARFLDPGPNCQY